MRVVALRVAVLSVVLSAGGMAGLAGSPAVQAASTPASAQAHASTVRMDALAVAIRQVGKPYRSGSAGPDAFDCSGLTSFSFAQAGRVLPRRAIDQYRALPHVPLSQVRPGDLVFMASSGSSTDPARINHVGIYAGNNQWIVARRTGSTIAKQTLWTRNVWVARP